jgi:hypothetical protein
MRKRRENHNYEAKVTFETRPENPNNPRENQRSHGEGATYLKNSSQWKNLNRVNVAFDVTIHISLSVNG